MARHRRPLWALQVGMMLPIHRKLTNTPNAAAVQLLVEELRRSSAEYSLRRLTAISATQDLLATQLQEVANSRYKQQPALSTASRHAHEMSDGTLEVLAIFKISDGFFTDHLLRPDSLHQKVQAQDQTLDTHVQTTQYPCLSPAKGNLPRL